MPLAYGGGINKLDDIRRLFEIGFEKVIVNCSLEGMGAMNDYLRPPSKWDSWIRL
jgi:imidazole glycerol phosphate synthase subunit HisF